MTATPRRTPVSGAGPWATVARAQWSHLDRWFALVAAASFAGGLGARTRVGPTLRSSLNGRGAPSHTPGHRGYDRSNSLFGGDR